MVYIFMKHFVCKCYTSYVSKCLYSILMFCFFNNEIQVFQVPVSFLTIFFTNDTQHQFLNFITLQFTRQTDCTFNLSVLSYDLESLNFPQMDGLQFKPHYKPWLFMRRSYQFLTEDGSLVLIFSRNNGSENCLFAGNWNNWKQTFNK